MHVDVDKPDDKPDDQENPIERDFGALEERVANALKAIEEHGERLTNVEGDKEWITRRFEALEAMAERIPSPEFREEIQKNLNDLADKIATIPSKSEASSTELPPHDNHKKTDGERHDPLKRLF